MDTNYAIGPYRSCRRPTDFVKVVSPVCELFARCDGDALADLRLTLKDAVAFEASSVALEDRIVLQFARAPFKFVGLQLKLVGMLPEALPVALCTRPQR
jgi:hypothetical protein